MVLFTAGLFFNLLALAAAQNEYHNNEEESSASSGDEGMFAKDYVIMVLILHKGIK